MGPTLDAGAAKKQLKNLAVLLLAMGVAAAYVLWRIGGESGKIQQLCNAAPGKPPAQLEEEVEKLGLLATFSKGSALIHGKRTFGRVVCLVEYEGGAVKKAQFSAAD